VARVFADFNKPAVLPDFNASTMGAQFDCELHRITTTTIHPKTGQVSKVTGLLALPVDTKRQLPLISWQHGTLFSYDQVPSNLTRLVDPSYEPTDATDSLGCLCIPSVRNGHVTDEMYDFLESSTSCLLNLNLYPTLAAEERHSVSARLAPLLPKSLLSISFSRGFGLTASQLGVFLVHKEHPYRSRFEQQWNWLTYFHNSIAVRTLIALNLDDLQAVDTRRRTWVSDWLQDHGLPAIASGSYYVKSFLTDRDVPQHLQPLVRDGLLRLCFKPPITMIEVGRTEGAKNRRGLSRASPSSVHS